MAPSSRMASISNAGRSAGALATVGFLGIAVFQAALALGAPLGKAAWGGGSSELSTSLRVGSGISLLVQLVAAGIVSQCGGLWKPVIGLTFARRGTWFLAGLMLIGSAMNWISRSSIERYTWGPITLVMAVLCVVVARSSAGEESSQEGRTQAHAKGR